MASLPYYPLHPKDICTDFRMIELKGEERGLFLYLLCWLWIEEDKLKDNDYRISRLLGIAEKKWNSLRWKLINSGLLKVDADGCIRNKRLTNEFIAAREKCEKKKDAANKRWDDDRASKAKSNKESENDNIKPITEIIYPDDDDGMALND